MSNSLTFHYKINVPSYTSTANSYSLFDFLNANEESIMQARLDELKDKSAFIKVESIYDIYESTIEYGSSKAYFENTFYMNDDFFCINNKSSTVETTISNIPVVYVPGLYYTKERFTDNLHIQDITHFNIGKTWDNNKPFFGTVDISKATLCINGKKWAWKTAEIENAKDYSDRWILVDNTYGGAYSYENSNFLFSQNKKYYSVPLHSFFPTTDFSELGGIFKFQLLTYSWDSSYDKFGKFTFKVTGKQGGTSFSKTQTFTIKLSSKGVITLVLPDSSTETIGTLALNTWYWCSVYMDQEKTHLCVKFKEHVEGDDISNVMGQGSIGFEKELNVPPAGSENTKQLLTWKAFTDYFQWKTQLDQVGIIYENTPNQITGAVGSTKQGPKITSYTNPVGDAYKYISIYCGTPETATITITDNNDVSITKTGVKNVSLIVEKGHTVTWTVEAEGYTTQSGTETLSDNVQKTVTLEEEEKVFFTIKATPSDATTTINGLQQLSAEVVKGSTVTWSVEKTGYVTQSGEEVVTETTLKNITLVEESGIVEPTVPTDYFYAWVNPNNPTGNNWYTLTETPTQDDFMYVSAIGVLQFIEVGNKEGRSSLTLQSVDGVIEGTTLTVAGTAFNRNTSYDSEYYLCQRWIHPSTEYVYLTKNTTVNTGDTVYRFNDTTNTVYSAGTIGVEFNMYDDVLYDYNDEALATYGFTFVKSNLVGG